MIKNSALINLLSYRLLHGMHVHAQAQKGSSYGYGLIQVPQAIDAAETYFGDAGSDPEPSPEASDSGSSEDDQSTNSGSLVSDRVKNLVQKTLFYSILKKLGIR